MCVIRDLLAAGPVLHPANLAWQLCGRERGDGKIGHVKEGIQVLRLRTDTR